MSQETMTPVGYIQVPELAETEYYSRAAGNPTRGSEGSRDTEGLSATFVTNGLVRDYGASDTFVLVLETRNMVGKFTRGNIRSAQEFDALPDFNPNRPLFPLNAEQVANIDRICRGVQVGAAGVIKYEDAGIVIEIMGESETVKIELPAK